MMYEGVRRICNLNEVYSFIEEVRGTKIKKNMFLDEDEEWTFQMLFEDNKGWIVQIEELDDYDVLAEDYYIGQVEFDLEYYHKFSGNLLITNTFTYTEE